MPPSDASTLTYRARESWRRPRTLLILVAVLHAVSPLILLGAHWWFGIDETVYLSQLNAHVPAGGFSAPRARGATFIAAPITLLTQSVVAVRLWVATLSGLALYAAFAPWLKLRQGYLVPLAALLLSGIWSVIYYGFEVMPNEWVAFGVVAACGYVLRFCADGRTRQLTAVVIAMTVVGLLRPSDAIYAGVALVLGCAFVRVSARRRMVAGVAVVVGVGLGLAEWVIEAEIRYGGLLARIHAAQAENGGGGFHFAGAAQARALAGPLLCRAGCHASAPLIYRVWWIGLAALVLVAIAGGRARADRRVLLPLFVGLVMAGQYVFAVTYAAPRFLIPSYALLALPAAAGALRLAGLARTGRPRAALRLVLVGLLVANIGIQIHVLTARVASIGRVGNGDVLASAHLLRDVDRGRPCLVLGDPGTNQDLAYAADCANEPRTRTAIRDKLAHGTTVFWLRSSPPARYYGTDWRLTWLPGPTLAPAYISAVTGNSASTKTVTALRPR